MRRFAAAGVTALVLSSVLAGCSSGSPKARLASDSNDVVSAANAGDAAAVRTAAGRMLEEINKQNNAGDLTTPKANSLKVLLTRILANAGDLEATASPSPAPSSEAPSPSPSPSPPPSPSPSPSPEPSSAAPSPTEAPPSPDVVPSVLSPQPLAPKADEASAQPTPS